MESRNILWIIIAVAIVALFLSLASSGFSGISSTGKSTDESKTEGTTIINSYNTYNYYNSDSQKYSRKYSEENYNYPNYLERAERTTVKGVLGNDIDRYIVYVKNKGEGKYFTIRFIFEDYFDEISTQSMTKYIKTDQEVKFVYQDIYNDRYKYNDWDYEIIVN